MLAGFVQGSGFGVLEMLFRLDLGCFMFVCLAVYCEGPLIPKPLNPKYAMLKK